MVDLVFKGYPNKVVAFAPEADSKASQTVKLLEGRDRVDGKTTACLPKFLLRSATDSRRGPGQGVERGGAGK